MNGMRFISRLIREAVGTIHNTLNDRTVELYFQMSPGQPGGTPRGINALSYQVRYGGAVIRRDTTGTDGKATVLVRRGRATVELTHNSNPVASYAVTATSLGYEPVTDIEGQKERLRRLGYHIGHLGTHGDGVDTNDNLDRHLSILDFQADQKRDHVGTADAGTQSDLRTQAGG